MIKLVKSLRVYPKIDLRESASTATRLSASIVSKRKLHEVLFTLLVILLPVQLGKHFWPDWTRVLGLKIDYLSPALYLTDILAVGIFVSWIFERYKGTKIQRGSQKSHSPRECETLIDSDKARSPGVEKSAKRLPVGFVIFLALLVFFLINAFLSSSQPVAFFKLFKLLELSLLTFYVSRSNYPLSAIRYPLVIAVIWSSALAVVQFLTQSSVGGVFWWLGERTFDISTPGIAKIDLGGRLFLRPYSTFSHPNSMAGFLLIALILLNDKFPSNLKFSSLLPYQFFRRLTSIFKPQPSTFNLQPSTFNLLLDYLALILGTAAIALSFSRSVWVVAVFVGAVLNFFYLKTKKTSRKFWVLAIIFWSVVFGALGFFTSKSSFAEPFSERIFLNQAAVEMIKDHPFFGVGLNNFLVRLPDYWSGSGVIYLLQPVHNIILLAGAELGILGLLGFFGLLGLTYARLFYRRFLITNYQLLISALTIVLLLGLVDHYWLTLQQNQLLLAVVLGLAWRKK